MAISKAGINLIKQFESFRGQVYKSRADVWTIGYGATLGLRPGDVMTLKQAEARLISELVIFEAAVNERVSVPITQGQFDALVSLAFNVGIIPFKRSRLLKLVNAGEFDAASREFSKWVLPGLAARRAAEQELFEQRTMSA
jgi:lysozyme